LIPVDGNEDNRRVARSREQRLSDTLEKLKSEVDVWVASASSDGVPPPKNTDVASLPVPPSVAANSRPASVTTLSR